MQKTVESPDFVQQGDYGTLIACKFYPHTPLTSKYLIVVYKEIDKTDGFILTSYFTNQPNKNRKTLWKHLHCFFSLSPEQNYKFEK